jgi:hypothetical protein
MGFGEAGEGEAKERQWEEGEVERTMEFWEGGEQEEDGWG